MTFLAFLSRPPISPNSLLSLKTWTCPRRLATMSNQPPSCAPPPQPSVADLRVNYSNQPLHEHSLPDTPYPLFAQWMSDATQVNEHEPNAMCLSTVDHLHRPSGRMVLLKAFDHKGFVWYTNYTSRKADQLKVNPNAALTFWWPTLQRSVRIEGVAHVVDQAESDQYFNSRPVDSRLGALASDQSSPIQDRSILQSKWQKLKEQYLDDEGQLIKPLVRPLFWGGYRLVAQRIEFWKGRPARLHDRIVYQRQSAADKDEDQKWTKTRLEP